MTADAYGPTYGLTGLTPEQLREQLLLERFGDVGDLQRERPLAPQIARDPREDPHMPKPDQRPTIRLRPPAPTGRYLPEHDAARAWLRRSHPEWEPQLAVFDRGSAAHVIIRRDRREVATTRCGRRGATFTASSQFPICRHCVITGPTSR